MSLNQTEIQDMKRIYFRSRTRTNCITPMSAPHQAAQGTASEDRIFVGCDGSDQSALAPCVGQQPASPEDLKAMAAIRDKVNYSPIKHCDYSGGGAWGELGGGNGCLPWSCTWIVLMLCLHMLVLIV